MMKIGSGVSDPVAKVLAARESLGTVQRITYHSTGSMTIIGSKSSITLPAGSCKPATAADITDLLNVGDHTKTLPLFSTGGNVEIKPRGATFHFTITGTL